MAAESRIRIVLYTEQAFVAEGLAAICLTQADLELSACWNSVGGTIDSLHSMAPDVLLVHVLAGLSLSDLRAIKLAGGGCSIILWGQELGGEFAFQAMQLGVRGILGGKISISDFLAAVRNVHRGGLCFDRDLLESVLSKTRVVLTPREGQVIALVSQGLKNKEIAFALGLAEGTIKVYLYRLFKKLGMNDRLDMALYGRKNLFGGQSGLERNQADVARNLLPGKPEVALHLVARKPAGATVVH